jgi:hypothetical protein
LPSIFNYIDYPILIESTDFEPILEDATSSAEFAGYEQYWRQEIPRLFRQELEVVAQEEVVIIEARLRDRLVDIIRLCQDQAVSNYLNHRSSSAPGVARPEPDTEPTTSPIPPQSTSLPSSIGIALPSSITPEDYPVDGSDTLDQPLRNGNNPRTIPTSTPLEHRLRDARQNELSDSGYISTGSSFQDTPDIEMPSRPLPGVEPRSQMASPNVQPHQSVTSLTCHQGENTHDETFYGEMTISPYPIIDGPEWPFLLE